MKKDKDLFIDYVLDQLRPLTGVSARPMFGGFGLYKDSVFFSAVAEGRLFFRVSDRTRPDYEAEGMPPFAPYKMKPMRSYYEVPPDVLESPSRLKEWAEAAVTAAREAKAAGRKGNTKTKMRSPL